MTGMTYFILFKYIFMVESFTDVSPSLPALSPDLHCTVVCPGVLPVGMSVFWLLLPR